MAGSGITSLISSIGAIGNIGMSSAANSAIQNAEIAASIDKKAGDFCVQMFQ